MSDIEVQTYCPVGSDKHKASDEHGKPTGHPLCGNHYKQLGKTLRGIEDELGDLSAVPSIAVQWNTAGGGHSGGGSPANEQSPARLDALVLTEIRRGRGDSETEADRLAAGRVEPVLLVLCEYAWRVRAEREFELPTRTITDCVEHLPGTTPHGPSFGLPCRHPFCSGVTHQRKVLLPLTVKSERTLLTNQLPWIVKWPDIDAVFSRLRRVLSQLKALNGTSQSPLGKCPDCQGNLWPLKPQHSVGEWKGSTPDAVGCNDCSASWVGPSELAVLALRLEEQRRVKAA